MPKKPVPGLESVFVYRALGQNSLQATITRDPVRRPLIIPRSGTVAPLGSPTLIRQPIPPEK